MTKIERVLKSLGKETVSEIEALSSAELESRIVQANDAMQTAYNELEANEQWQALKERKKDMESATKEVSKRQNALIFLAVHLLKEKGAK